jgi:LPS O-antigen subunit length determinant protein (WzzB/FepE family)
MEEALKRFDRLVTVTVDRRTRFVRLAFKARTPKLANSLAQAMIADLNEEMRARALAEAQQIVHLLSERIATEQYASIRDTAAALLESQLKREVVAEVRKEYALKTLDAPSLPETRYYPRRTRMVIIGAFFGTILGAMWVLVRTMRSAHPAQ